MQLLEALNYMGPNRRFDCTAIEMLVAVDRHELQSLARHLDTLPSRTREVLERSGLALPMDFPEPVPGQSEIDTLGALFCQVSILLQRHAGHDVHEWRIVSTQDENQRRFIYEHEERVTAEKAGDIALLILAQLVPGLTWQTRTDETGSDPVVMIDRFTDLARPLAMPRDTLELIAAAQRLDIPCVKLERDPYQPLPGPHRIRANSLLMLGHSRHRQIVDGTICVTRSQNLLPLVADRASRLALLQTMGMNPGDDTRLRKTHSAILAGQEFLCLADTDQIPGKDIVRQLEQVARSVPCGMLGIDFSIDDAGRGIHIHDLDFAPRLDIFSALDDRWHKLAAERFMKWIYPPGTTSRIPIIAVTGTNGKSTTTAMIDHVMRHAGFKTGVAYSSGVRIDGKTTETGDLSGLMGHYRVFESPEPEIAVLETARGGVAQRGFAFGWCNIGVCLNVEDDHMGLLGIDTIEQMAEIKRSIVARARDVVILNADNGHSLNMAGDLKARKKCLVSTEKDIDALRESGRHADAYCLLEPVDQRPWLVIYLGDQRIPVVRVEDIPATENGRLAHNIINAAHAAATCIMHGIPVEKTRSALQQFRLDSDVLLGRWNEVPGLPFKAIFDYAHNAHGYGFLVQSLKNFDFSGTRRVAFSCSGDRTDRAIRSAVAILRQGFDEFLVSNFDTTRGRVRGEIPRLVKAALTDEGVNPDHITIFDSEDEAVKAGLEISRPGDLLVVLAGKVSMRRIWQQMCEFGTEGGNSA